MRLGQVLRKPGLIALSRLAVVGIKSTAWKYCASSGLVVWTIMLFSTISDLLYLQGNLPHSCLLLPGDFNYFLSIILD